MSAIPPPLLRPSPGERGLISQDPEAMVRSTLSAWDVFVACASEVDPRTPVRKRSAGAAIAEMGTWPGSRTLNDMRADCHAGRTELGPPVPPGIPPHPTTVQLVEALQRSRDSLAEWIDSVPSWREEALLPTPSILGPLPLLTTIHGVAYPLALTALDLQAAGITAPPDLLDAGLNALVDTTGALAARANVRASITARLPTRQFGAGATDGNWCTRDLGSASPAQAGPAVIGEVTTVLNATAGRADVIGLYRSGDLRFHDLPGLLHWVPVVESVPGLPGGRTLGRAGRYLGAVTNLWSKLPLTR